MEEIKEIRSNINHNSCFFCFKIV